MPGPDNIFVLTESLRKGSAEGVLLSVGLCIGILVHTTIAATGLSIIIQQSDIVFNIIKYMGATYLLYLAIKSYQDDTLSMDIEVENKEQAKSQAFPLIRKGFFMNVLNPKVSLFFLALLPQFVSAKGVSVAYQMIALGLIFMLQAFFIFSGIAVLAGRLTPYLKQSQFWKITKWVQITVLLLLSISLALSTK